MANVQDYIIRAMDAFGLDGPPVPVQNGVYRVGSWILKEEMHKDEALWRCRFLDRLQTDKIRVPKPRRTRGGAWLSGRVSCFSFLAGRGLDHPTLEDFLRIIEAGVWFHEAVETVARPSFLSIRQDNWTQADKIAWGEVPYAPDPAIAELYGELVRLSASADDSHAQLIHGDLTGNVLLSADLPPAVIDFSPYWRNPEYAYGIILADAFTWYGATEDLLDKALAMRSAQLVPHIAKGLLFRLVTQMEAPGQTAATRNKIGEQLRFCRLLRDRIGGVDSWMR